MAVMNFGVCLVLVLYQLSSAYSDEASSESADLGLTGEILNSIFKEIYTNKLPIFGSKDHVAITMSS